MKKRLFSEIEKRTTLFLLPVLLSLFLIIVFASGEPFISYTSVAFSAFGKLAFMAALPLALSFLLAKSYLLTGFASILLMGCGVLAFAGAGFFSGFAEIFEKGISFYSSINGKVAFLSSLLHLSCAIQSSVTDITGIDVRSQREKWLALIISYTGILLTVVILLFFVPPLSSTLESGFRLSAITFFAAAFVLLLTGYLRSRIGFLYWYALSLSLLGLGVLVDFIKSPPGGALYWTGWASACIGGLYFYFVVLSLLSESERDNVSAEKTAARYFRDVSANYRELLNIVGDAIITFNEEKRVILWNPAAERMFGYNSNEAQNLRFDDLFADPSAVESVIKAKSRKIFEGDELYISGPFEMVMKTKFDDAFPAVLTTSRRKIKGEEITTTIIKDITELRLTEEELRRSYNELEKRVRDRTRELRILSTKLLTVQEEERKRIAQDLHDSMLHSLVTFKFAVQNLASGNELPHHIRESIEELIPMIQYTIDETRKIINDLRPAALDKLGIVEAANALFDDFANACPHIKVEKVFRCKEEDIPDERKIVIYRLLQEGLNNIAKHSEATQAVIKLQKEEEGMSLSIEDNGKGFDPNNANPAEGNLYGIGLASMRERCENSGGYFQLHSAKGCGTHIRIFWPYQTKLDTSSNSNPISHES
ncbi:MAG: hypothetical protein DRP87_07930 [Spirochaetes bacterium]|nr:MAG: hypothetical protein DRP87_07930 [Spirochaetota bacterium]